MKPQINNLVAKHCRSFCKPKIQQLKTSYKRKSKHKELY